MLDYMGEYTGQASRYEQNRPKAPGKPSAVKIVGQDPPKNLFLSGS